METEKERVFRQVLHLLGAPIRRVELTNEMLESFFEMSIEDYSLQIQNWLIENQWFNLYNKDLKVTDVLFALGVRDDNFEANFAFVHSKQVGLQSRGPFELKKDFINVEHGRQSYEIPAGREINKVLWVTPPSIDHVLYNNWYGGDSNTGSFPFSSNDSYGGMHGVYMAPTFDIILRDMDASTKRNIARSELMYKVTAGPNGTHILHLFSVPGSKSSLSSPYAGGKSIFHGCKVWYHYYETTKDNVDECRQFNDDIIRFPHDVPLRKINFDDLNEPTRTWVRRYMVALAKEALGRVRGKFSGKGGAPDAEYTLDYAELLSEAKEEKEKLITEILSRMERMDSAKLLEKRVSEIESLRKIQANRPNGIYVK